MRYLLDSNIIIVLNRHLPRDVHVGIWEALEELIGASRAFLQRECLEELARGDDSLVSWAKSFDGFVIESTEPEMLRVAQISNAYPGWIQESKNFADPWLIACAEAHDLTLVTDESLKGPQTAPRNMTIPTVVAGLSSPVKCFKSLDMQRREQWRFGRA